MIDALLVQKVRPVETDTIAQLIAGAEAGHGGGLTLVGAPGEGRTALLRAAATMTRGGPVLITSGHRGERDLPYAGLGNLITGLRELITELEPAQRAALMRGLGGEVRPGDRLALGLALTTLWGTAGARRPVLCLIDDAHLLDQRTWETVVFAARRLAGARVAVLATAAAGRDPGGLPAHRLAALTPSAARVLLAEHAPDLAAEVAEAVARLAGGNPGALTDFAASLTPEQRRGYAPLPEALPVGSALRRRYRAEVAALPERTRRLLLLAACRPAVPTAGILAAEAVLAGPPAALPDSDDLAAFAPAERAGLVDVDGAEVRFRSEAVRGCLYADVPASGRRAAHAALADVLAGTAPLTAADHSGPRGSAGDAALCWNTGAAELPALLQRAAATSGPDPVLAARLEQAARSAEPALATEAHRLAAGLCADPGGRGVALLDAARAAWLSGRPHDAGLLVRQIPRAAVPAQVRARGLAAAMRLPEGRPGARELLLDVAADLADSDTDAALEALALAGEAAVAPGEQGRYAGLARRVAARQRGDESLATTLAFHHVAGLARLADGDEPAAFARFRRELDLADRISDPGLLIRAATSGIVVGDAARAAALAGRAAELADASGARVLVPQALEVAALAGLAAGDYRAANIAAMDGTALARVTGQPVLAGVHMAVLAVLAALVGDRATALSRIEASAGGPARPLCEWSLALLDLVDGRAAVAAQRLIGVVTSPPGYGSALLRVAVVPHLLEAAAQDTEAFGLDAVATTFDRWAGRTGQPAWLALRDRCRALRARDTEAAEGYFAAALRHTGEAGFPRAHTELLYGRMLRRRRRHVEARTHLRRAAETFRLLDAGPWAEQSVRELRAAGERVEPPAAVPDGLGLTAQQERIAVLVAGGATNREVAQELHLSPRTVDHHLRNVFARLGVRSRTEMARMFSTR